jgi:DNA primase
MEAKFASTNILAVEPGGIPQEPQEHFGYMFRKALGAIKDEVAVEDYLTDLGIEVKHGRSKCPIHEGDNPQALAVYPKHRRWFCFRCNEGGNVVDLCRTVEGGELWEAVVGLAQRFNVELPCRPARWSRRQEEKARQRAMIREVLTRSYQRRFFRVFGDCALENIVDEAERKEEARRMFEGFYPVARVAAMNRLERRRG